MKKDLIFCSVIITAVLFSCSSSKNIADNLLSKKEKNKGYTLLLMEQLQTDGVAIKTNL